MFKPILLIWFLANFALAGAASLFLGGWYLSQPPLKGMALELGLIMLPNLLLPIWALRLPAFHTPVSAREALGWKWSGARAALSGVGAFVAIYLVSYLVEKYIGPSIPYNLPGSAGPVQASGLWEAIGLLLILVAFVTLTVVAEETMFRGFIQSQVMAAHGMWAGMIFSTILFGLRHLPADIFYAQSWSASPLMWISRELQLYGAALFLSAARIAGRSTYAPAIAHTLLLLVALFGG